MGGNLKVWVFNFRGKIFGGNTTVYISSGETNTVYPRPQASWADGLYEAVCPACLWPLGYPRELSYVYSEH